MHLVYAKTEEYAQNKIRIIIINNRINFNEIGRFHHLRQGRDRQKLTLDLESDNKQKVFETN